VRVAGLSKVRLKSGHSTSGSCMHVEAWWRPSRIRVSRAMSSSSSRVFCAMCARSLVSSGVAGRNLAIWAIVNPAPRAQAMSASGYRLAYWHAVLTCAGVAAFALLVSLLGMRGRPGRPSLGTRTVAEVPAGKGSGA
jgi:hypothetical protein